MTTDGWEQRLADLGQARELREAIAQTVAARLGWHGIVVRGDPARDLADAILSGPLAPLLELAADPLHEVSCPSCGATIRARMADQP